MAKSKALIFDLGNVVFHCSMDNALAYWAKCSGQDMESLKVKLDLNNPVHDQFERGEITEDEFRHFISNKIGFALSAAEFQGGWNSIYGEEISGLRELIDEWSVSYIIIGLTNSNKTHAAIWERKYETVLARFDKIFSSHEIHARKPENKAYQICIDYLGLPPSRLIFLDDRIENIEACHAAGMTGILVTSFEQMKADLIKLTSMDATE